MGLTREQFEQLTNRSPDIIVGTDRKGRVIYFNDGAHDNLGYESEEVLGAVACGPGGGQIILVECEPPMCYPITHRGWMRLPLLEIRA